jgi:hypothetical protein
MTAQTSAYLASELRKLGLEDLAQSAEKDEYHDFLSPYPLPEMKLVKDLAVEATKWRDEEKIASIMALRQRVINGDFDASTAESEAWAASPEGQEAFRLLASGSGGKKDAKT